MKARVYRSGKRLLECKVIGSGQMVSAVPLAMVLKQQHVVVGDYVELDSLGNNEFQISRIYPRSNEIARRNLREKTVKIIASNCDVMLIVMSLGAPEYKRGLVDRYLVRACMWDIPAYLVFNKADFYEEAKLPLDFERDRIASLGVECFEVCALNPSYAPRFLRNGMIELKEKLKDKTAIVVGQSGVGKSKLISSLSEGKLSLLSGDLGKEGKGTHTTTWAELVDCEDFHVIDSPGVRSFALDDLDPDELINFFPDLHPIASICKFSNCQHDEKSVGCAFYNKLDPNSDQTKLLFSRLESYRKIFEESSQVPQWEKKARR